MVGLTGIEPARVVRLTGDLVRRGYQLRHSPKPNDASPEQSGLSSVGLLILISHRFIPHS